MFKFITKLFKGKEEDPFETFADLEEPKEPEEKSLEELKREVEECYKNRLSFDVCVKQLRKYFRVLEKIDQLGDKKLSLQKCILNDADGGWEKGRTRKVSAVVGDKIYTLKRDYTEDSKDKKVVSFTMENFLGTAPNNPNNELVELFREYYRVPGFINKYMSLEQERRKRTAEWFLIHNYGYSRYSDSHYGLSINCFLDEKLYKIVKARNYEFEFGYNHNFLYSITEITDTIYTEDNSEGE